MSEHNQEQEENSLELGAQVIQGLFGRGGGFLRFFKHVQHSSMYSIQIGIMLGF